MKTSTILNSQPFEKAKKSRKEKHALYSMLTFVLIICLIQAIRGAVLNVENYFSLNRKISKLEQIRQQSTEENIDLKAKIAEFKSMQGVEDVARNELKMAGKDEVLLLIKDKAKDSPAEAKIVKENKQKI